MGPIERARTPKEMIVITNDKGLAMHAKSAGAKVQANSAFIQWLQKRKKSEKAAAPRETQQNIDRLLKIFEERLKDDLS